MYLNKFLIIEVYLYFLKHNNMLKYEEAVIWSAF